MIKTRQALHLPEPGRIFRVWMDSPQPTPAMNRLSPFLVLLALVFSFSPLSAEESAPYPPDLTALAELPHWPMGWKLPEEFATDRTRRQETADIMVWLPSGDAPLRSLFIVPNNTDSKDFTEWPALREVAGKHRMGIIYLRRFETGLESAPADAARRPAAPERMQRLLDDIADQLDRPEIRHAPWITFGKSSRGSFPFRMGWLFPERTIASVVYHGETPTWPISAWAAPQEESILHLSTMGETEWGGTWFVHVRPSLLNYQLHTPWLTQLVVGKDLGHGDYGDEGGRASPDKMTRPRIWDYITLFIDKALTLRMPEEGVAMEGQLTLRQVDRNTGYLIEPQAIEALFGIPQLPLRQNGEGQYLVGSGETPPVSGFASFQPRPGFTVPENVPVVRLSLGESPREWLITDSLKFAMQTDPMREPEEWAGLMPAVGDEVKIDGETLVFAPIEPRHVAENGGIRLDAGLKPPNRNITLLAYTVLEVPEKQFVRVQTGYTAATRIQMVINGQPVKHNQVLELAPGRYPMLILLRMSANWGRIEPALGNVSEEQIAQAVELQQEIELRAAEQAAGTPPPPVIHPASSVRPEDRARMFWVPDREMAEAWFDLHNIRNRPVDF